MFRLIVNGKNGREESDFATAMAAQQHFDYYRSLGHWGHEEYTIDHPEIPAVIVEHPEVPAEVIEHEEIPATVIEHPEIPAVIIEHPEVLEIPAQPNNVPPAPAVPGSPAWTEVISEAIPAWTEVVSEAVPAWTEVVTEAIPAWTEVISEAIPAWTETVPAQFSYEIVGVSVRLEDISPRQIALALLSMGITESQVIAAINQLPSPTKEQGIIAWNRSNYFVRTEPAVAMIGALMGLTNEELDNIWKLGITL